MGQPSSTVGQQRKRIEPGVERIADGMQFNLLLLNPEKTDFQWCTISRQCGRLDSVALNICGTKILPSTAVCDLGIMLESDMFMKHHVAWTIGRCFRQLSFFRGCARSLLFEAARVAVFCFVTFQVDRCNSVPSGVPLYLRD